jgi:uncharacterized repeat protein (TIGR03803 family)
VQCKQQFRNLILSIISGAAAAALAIAVVFALVVLTQSAQAQSPAASAVWTEKVLHSFGNGTDGVSPQAGLISDAAGNLYGTTSSGGTYTYYGTVFELTPTAGGGWTEQVLHSFNNNGTDGLYPSSGLIFDAAGNLYGTTSGGGDYSCNGSSQCGTVFELSPTEGGGWTETVLHSFGNGTDGIVPYANLVFDTAGNLYGTTQYGGTYGGGTVFELSPTAGGGRTEQVLYSFNCTGPDGCWPEASLIFDAVGNLYGTTSYGGTYFPFGTAFELTPAAGGGWTEQVLHSFGSGIDGAYPHARLIFDAVGNLYGTTGGGGLWGYGTVFELAPTVGGGWMETVLYSFCWQTNCADGWMPDAGLIFDAAGNLYGTTYYGGAYNYSGTVFELTPAAGGGWTERVLYSFGSGTDGASPQAGLIFDASGNFYGTTYSGGTYNYGTAFELTPVYPCAKCSHSMLREGDVLPAERRDVLEHGRDRTN